MSEMKQAWDNVGDRLSGLGLKLKYHLEQDMSDDDSEAVVSALKRLGDAIEDTVEAFGHAAKDPAVHEDVKGFGRSFFEALSVTAEEAGAKIKDVVDRQRAGSGCQPPPPGSGATDEGPTPPAPSADDGPTPPAPAADDDVAPDDGLTD